MHPECAANSTTRIAVVVPVHNAAQYLEQTLRSVVEQEHAPVRITVVDDGSTDGSAEIVREFMLHYPMIELISNVDAQGPSAARNRGWRKNVAEWIAFVDADDLWHSSHLRNFASAVQLYPTAAVVFCDNELFRTQPVFALDRLDGQHHAPLPVDDVAFGLFSGTMSISQSGVMIRRSCLESSGGYDESRRYAEDLELWARLSTEYKFVRVPEKSLAYRLHGQQTSARNAKDMYASAWEIRRKLRTLAVPASPTAVAEWQIAEEKRMRYDLTEAWRSGQKDAFDTMLDLAAASSLNRRALTYWRLRRSALWYPYVLYSRLRRLRASAA